MGTCRIYSLQAWKLGDHHTHHRHSPWWYDAIKMSFLVDQFNILWTCLIYPHLVLFTLHSHLHLHSLCTATRYIYKCRKYKGEQWLILCFLLIWIFLFRANLLPPGHIWLCNRCWQILQLVLLEREVWNIFHMFLKVHIPGRQKWLRCLSAHRSRRSCREWGHTGSLQMLTKCLSLFPWFSLFPVSCTDDVNLDYTRASMSCNA